MGSLWRIKEKAIFIDKNLRQFALSEALFVLGWTYGWNQRHPSQFSSLSIHHNRFFPLRRPDVLAISDPSEIIEKFPDTKEYIEDNRIHAFVVVRVKDYGFIGVMENNISRMWQDSDLVLLYFAATELKNRLDKKE